MDTMAQDSASSASAQPDARLRVGIVGGSGSVGAELLRYLVVHPRVSIEWVTANSKAGARVDSVLANLRGFTDLEFIPLEAAREGSAEVDCVFVALPHRESQRVVPGLAERFARARFIDMGGDFRTPDPVGFRRYYGAEHAAPEWLERFCYGFAEYRRRELPGARLVANPGCFATSLLLALSPLAVAGELSGDVFATGVTGSSGSGNTPSATTHHPQRATNFRSYKPLAHQHLLEVTAFVRGLAEKPFELHFVPQSGPFVRGVFTTVFTPHLGPARLEEIFHGAYADAPLVDVFKGSPELRLVQGTPRSLVGVAGEGDRGVVFVAIDNLGKGAAGQAVQNLNLMFGLDETTGLRVPGGFV